MPSQWTSNASTFVRSWCRYIDFCLSLLNSSISGTCVARTVTTKLGFCATIAVRMSTYCCSLLHCFWYYRSAKVTTYRDSRLGITATFYYRSKTAKIRKTLNKSKIPHSFTAGCMHAQHFDVHTLITHHEIVIYAQYRGEITTFCFRAKLVHMWSDI